MCQGLSKVSDRDESHRRRLKNCHKRNPYGVWRLAKDALPVSSYTKGSSGLCLEHDFLAPVQTPHPGSTDPSPHSADFLASTIALWGFAVQNLHTDKHETLPWALGLCLDS
ncbi:hypothetical protein GW7_14499 [Heterocephalus glaber]|uniref:Uncharacterized protein n=1 Tax=Heterocephalus glaber TaxID=10181 RepID=G5C826_HETGA|nr:hypothetical protein GW7_14499 [Heterocephalus glaber]